MAVFIPNPAFKVEFPRSSAWLIPAREIADDIADNAKAVVAEVDPDMDVHVEQTSSDTGVVSDDPDAGFIEFGTINNPTYAPLRRGAEAAGFEVKD